MKKLKFTNPNNFEDIEIEVNEEFHDLSNHIQICLRNEEPTTWLTNNIKQITNPFVNDLGTQFTFGIMTNSKKKYKIIIEELDFNGD